MNFAVTGKARSAVRRFVRAKDRTESIALGRKIYEEIVARLPTRLGKDAQTEAMKRLSVPDDAELMIAIARQKISDGQLMEALMPGSVQQDTALAQREAISIRGLTPGVAYVLAECCHPVPGDRIVGLRRPDEIIAVHTIECESLADGVDADWLDLAWGDGSDGATARLLIVLKNEPGALAAMAGIFGTQKANILNLRLDARDSAFHNFTVDLEVRDLQHLMKILAALRAADAVVQAARG